MPLKISIIGRCEYEKTCKILVEMFDKTAQEYQNLTKQLSNNNNIIKSENFAKSELKDLSVKQDQMTWLVYIIGGVSNFRF